MPSKIFISYRRRDSQDAAIWLCMNLETKFGKQTVFFDKADLKYGDMWKEKIKIAMQDAAVVLFVIGRHLLASSARNQNSEKPKQTDYVKYEIKTALRMGKTLIPVLVDNVKPPVGDKLKKLPQFIRKAFDRQFSRIEVSTNRNEGMDKLIECIIDKLGTVLPLQERFLFTVRNDKYKHIKLLAEGRSAYVFQATEVSLEREVAIKVVKEECEEEFKEILITASKIAARAPNCVQIYDAYLNQKPVYAVMAYLKEGTFRQIIKDTYPDKEIDAEVVHDCLLQIGDALRNAHKDNLTHCNIKPSNVLRSDNGVAYLSPLCILDDMRETAIKRKFFSEFSTSNDKFF